jgi:hypothetical protein
MGIVIVVGDVDTVDKRREVLYIGRSAVQPSGCGAERRERNAFALWRESPILIPRLIHNTRLAEPNLHLGQQQHGTPYLGVRNWRVSQLVPDFSTNRGTYPQKSASYPQSACFFARNAGFPYPLNTGALLCDYRRLRE